MNESITNTSNIPEVLERPSLFHGDELIYRCREINDTVADAPSDDSPSLNDDSEQRSITETKRHKEGYEGKKPLWWKRLSGRRATKGQRACLERMKAQGYLIASLPQYGEFVDLKKLFIASPGAENKRLHIKERELILEVGFGDGKNLFANARRNSKRLYLGADVHQGGVCSLLKQIEHHNQHSKSLLTNIKLYAGDGVKLIRYLPPASVSQIMLTFPDPWPNKHQEKFRIIQLEVINDMERILVNDGLVLLATDSKSFAEWSEQVFACSKQWVTCDPPSREQWLPEVSKYELEAINASRETILRCWRLNQKENFGGAEANPHPLGAKNRQSNRNPIQN